jgi:hypothetical protein
MIYRWAGVAGLDPAVYGTHSTRRTKETLIYKRTKNLRAVRLLRGHNKTECTIRCLASKSMTRLRFRNRLNSRAVNAGRTNRCCGGVRAAAFRHGYLRAQQASYCHSPILRCRHPIDWSARDPPDICRVQFGYFRRCGQLGDIIRRTLALLD